MQAIALTGSTSSPRFAVQDFEAPKPGPKDVLVKVWASSINPKDFKLNYNLARAALLSPWRTPKPLFGDDLSGEVIAVGSQVTQYQPGDAIYGMDMRLRTAAWAEQAIISQKRIAKIPKGLSAEEAAAIPLAAQTALQGLRLCEVKPGGSVLINGSSGGVGLFAVQMAKLMGMQVTAVCSHRNADRVAELGADQIIDYTQSPLGQVTTRFDAVFEVTGFLTKAQCQHLLKPDAVFVSTMGSPKTLLANLTSFDKNDRKVVVESHTHDLEQINTWYNQGQLKIFIDSVYQAEQAEEVFAKSRSGRAQGKIVIKMS